MSANKDYIKLSFNDIKQRINQIGINIDKVESKDDILSILDYIYIYESLTNPLYEKTNIESTNSGNTKIIRKNVKLEIDIEIARRMLVVAGFDNISSLTDDEILYKVLDMVTCYGTKVCNDTTNDIGKKRYYASGMTLVDGNWQSCGWSIEASSFLEAAQIAESDETFRIHSLSDNVVY